jgi:hypothetical protein
VWTPFRTENDRSTGALVVGIGDNKADNFMTSDNVVLRFEETTYLSRSEKLFHKFFSDKCVTEGSVFRRRESKYRLYDFHND